MKLADYKIERDGKMAKCPICSKSFKALGLASHFHKAHNPDYINLASTGCKRLAWNKGLSKHTDERVAKNADSVLGTKHPNRKPPSDELKIRISESMKKAHADGRAHNIGSSRWNNEPSYPEKFFAKVIANEFEDKDFVQEYPFGKYSLDFAWVHLKKVIEIDGDQHERFEKQKTSDARKDKALVDAGWQVLRVKWREMYSDTKVQIANCKQFLIAK